ncbi:MAG: SDR family oxidoreductase [Deltaproteobacteria bacterium]|nr:SDR family oxidoreductase [Deltaproteobacteria bacterium]
MAKEVYAGSDRFALEGRVAIVTGACGLLGEQFCQALLEAGAHVVVADIDGDRAQEAARGLVKQGMGAAIGVQLDVTRKDSLEAVKDTCLREFDRIDVLVNSAAINDRFDEGQAAEQSRFESYSLQAWQQQIEVNLTGSFLSCQVFGAAMAAQGRGSIINIGSTYGLVAPVQEIYRRPDGSQLFFKSAGYAASKGGVVMLTRFVATYWAHRGVRANVLCPGGVAQNQDAHFVEQYSSRTPMGRMAEPREIAGAAVFLASDAASYVTGAVFSVDGGWTAW